MRLRHWRDIQSLACLLAQPLLMAWQWRYGFNWLAFMLTCVLAVCISIVHHNHAHLSLWRDRRANRLTDLFITLLQGHPTWVFHPAHNRNHHRHCHGKDDVMRTWRFGDHNTLLGWLLHPLHAARVVYPFVIAWLWRLHRRAPRVCRWYALQHALWIGSWALLLAMDAERALLLVLIPQLIGLHWLLAANYLQHAHADEHAHYGYARNFEGASNWLLFNIGYHTAHHEHGRLHWSQLRALHHARYRHRVPSELNEPSLGRYILRVHLLGMLIPSLRTRSLRTTPSAHETSHAHVL